MNIKRINKTFSTFTEIIKIGDKVKVITAPRRYDNANTFAGYEGELIEFFKDGGVLIKGETSELIITNNNYKLKKNK